MIVPFDFETHLIKPGMVAPRPVVLSYQLANGGALADREGALRWFREHLSIGSIVAHNLAFDLVVAMAEWPGLSRLIFDAVSTGRARCTFIRQNLLDIAAGESEFRRVWHGTDLKVTKAGRALDDLVLLYFNEHLEKKDTWRLRYGELDGVSLDQWPEEARAYPMKDAEWAKRVFEAQVARAEGLALLPEMEGVWDSPHGEIPDEIPQTRAALWLQLMSSWGFRTDPIAVAKLKKEHEEEQASIKARLIPTGMIREDGTRDMKVIKARVVAAYEKLNIAVPSTPKCDTSTSGETLVDSGDPDLMMLGESLSDAATIGTWLPHLEAGTKHPICVGYNPIVDSGRASARKPNIQNPPRKGGIRACIIPRDGWLFSFADYDTAELRALAQVCIWLDLKYRDLADALITGEDPHLSLAADFEGITYEEAIARKKAGDKAINELRQLMKVPNFGLPGGLGAQKLVMYAHGYDPRFKKTVDLQVATRLRDAWFKKWREMRQYFECISGAIGRHGEGTIQQFWSKRVRGGVGFTQAANSTFQGLVADGAKRAGWMLARECYLGDWMYPAQGEYEQDLFSAKKPSPLFGSRPMLFMHDEFGLEIPNRNPVFVCAAAMRQGTVQRLAMQDVIPDIPIQCKAVITRRWLKGAERVFKDGILVPSKPIEKDGKITWVADEL